MTGSSFDKIKKFYNQCRPEEVLLPDDPRYVDLSARGLRGNEEPRRMLSRAILLSDDGKWTYQLLTGFSGSGKSTELQLLAHELRKNSDFVVVYQDAEEIIDITQPLKITLIGPGRCRLQACRGMALFLLFVWKKTVAIDRITLYNGLMSQKKRTYRTNQHITFSCNYHVVWCPKYRRPVLQGPVEARLKELLFQVCQELRVELLELEVMPDHIHLLVSVDPQLGIHRVVRRMKGRSSRILRQEFPSLASRLPTLWTHSYFVSTCGGTPLSVIKQYIKSQKDV